MNEASPAIRRAVLSAAILGSFVTPFLGSSINLALPRIGREFSLDAVALGWISTSYLLSAAAFLLPMGRLADLYGRKRLYLIGIALFVAASAVTALAPSLGFLLFGRLFQGLASSLLFGTGIALLTAVFPPGERGRALGLTVASVYAGLSLGPVLGGLITEHLGWRWIFWSMVPLGSAVFFYLARKVAAEWKGPPGQGFDLAGTFSYVLALAALVFGLSQPLATHGQICLGLGLAGLALFIAIEAKTPHPLLPLDLFLRNRVFAFSNLAAFISYSATFAVTFLLSLYLQEVLGRSPHQAGLILVVQPVLMVLFSPFAGRLSDRVEPRHVVSSGMALSCIGLFIFSRLHGQVSVGWVILGLVPQGIGLALFSSPNANAIMGSVGPKHLGVAGAMIGTMRLTGQLTSMALAMLVFSLKLGREKLGPDNLDAYLSGQSLIFLLFTGLGLFGIWCSQQRGGKRPPQGQELPQAPPPATD
ncbi:MAG: hypothetical protein A2284_08780 [Deltaproteobacteria bacterium RIFOXYA12_FULL_61_11]|nr:MAG: hypothetical protein A2284_08780 [Deltaproteobacteria bacterium RIFOXYA12_FULL_61_11]